MKTLADIPISILDLARVTDGGAISRAFANSRELAIHAEKLGYNRFWMAEHHNIEGVASAATAVLLGYIAGQTSKIRVGSGGIMLPNHAPMVIAEQFGTLETLYPGRIDLGLGRAPGSDQLTMRAIRGENFVERDFGDLIEELEKYFAPIENGQRLRAIPGAGIEIPLYILGSSLYSAQLAARLGRPYAFAGHFAPDHMIEAFEIYRHQFQPSKHLSKPYIMAGIPVIAADTDERARFLATSIQQSFLALIRRERRLSKPPVKDMDAIWSPREKAQVDSMLGLLITGGPELVRQKLDFFINEVGIDELIITSDPYEHADRMKSFEVIMQAKRL